jgi:leader peptidase (prepilin peptidase)/N-methyltransferase
MAIGAFVGWQGGVFCLLAGAAQGLIVALPILAWHKRTAPHGLELAPNPGEISASNPPLEQPLKAKKSALPGAPEVVSDPPPTYFGHIRIPFGPFLALSAIEYLFFGDQLVSAYLAMGEKMAGALQDLL